MAAPDIDPLWLEDVELLSRAAARDNIAARALTLRYNQRLFRAAFGVLRDRADAEDVVQDAWLKAIRGSHGFGGKSSLGTWLTRIVINEAIERKRARARRKRALDDKDIVVLNEYRDRFMSARQAETSPEAGVARGQIARLLETEIARLPAQYSLIILLRDVEEMSIEEASEALGISRQLVKTRLFRARRRLREALGPELREALRDSFIFAGADCARLTTRVLDALDVTGDQ